MKIMHQTMEEKLMRLPPGFRFHPTDEELVVQYLRRKVYSYPLPAAIIPEIDLAAFDPWDLPGEFEGEKYFFDLRKPKHRVGARATRSGYWKATGKDKPIVASKCGEPVGTKKVLVFYRGKSGARGSKTDWIMHEYRLPMPEPATSSMSPHRKNSSQCSPNQGKDWVVCRIFKKKRAPKIDEENTRHYGNPRVFRSDFLGSRDRMRNSDNNNSSSSPSSSCVTDLCDEECNKEEEATSKLLIASFK